MNPGLNNLLARMAAYGATSDAEAAPGVQPEAASQKSSGPALAPLLETDQPAGGQDSQPCDAHGLDDDGAFSEPLAAEAGGWALMEEGSTAESTLPVDTSQWMQAPLNSNEGEVETKKVALVAHGAHFSLRTQAEKTKKDAVANVPNSLDVEEGGSETCAPCAPYATQNDRTAALPRVGIENTAQTVEDLPETLLCQEAVRSSRDEDLEQQQAPKCLPDRAQRDAPGLVPGATTVDADVSCATEPDGQDGGASAVLTRNLSVECLPDRRPLTLPLGTRVRVFRRLTDAARRGCFAACEPLVLPLAQQSLSQGYVLVVHSGQVFRLPAWETRHLA